MRTRGVVEIEGQKSEKLKQTRGIRQGCPLSPYLFLAAMTCLFKDAYTECIEEEAKIVENRVQGTSYDFVLHADDTIIRSRTLIWLL